MVGGREERERWNERGEGRQKEGEKGEAVGVGRSERWEE